MLVTLLRPALAPKGITVEPEGHMVADKRADISAAMPMRKILCEWKRDYHADLWTAADQQLERFTRMIPKPKGSASTACSGSAKNGRHPCQTPGGARTAEVILILRMRRRSPSHVGRWT
jgi:hypothetical protein